MGSDDIPQPRDLLVLLPTDRDRDKLGDPPEEYELHWFEDENFDYPQPGPEFDMVEYTERASEYVMSEDIDGVLFSHDVANLVAGVLVDRHDLPGPPLESVFLADHKYYSRKNQPNVPWFDYIDMETGEWGDLDVQFPAYLKPPYLTLTLLQYRVDNQEEYDEAMEVINRDLSKYTGPFKDFFEAYVDTEKYPLAAKDTMLVEEPLEDWTQHCVEGWIDPDGEIHIWAISDHNYYDGNELAIDNYSTPSTLPSEDQAELIDIAKDAIVQHGYEHSFFNVEVFKLEDRHVITEVNGRTASVWEPLYQGAFDTSVYEGIIHLAANNPERTAAIAPDWQPDPNYDMMGAQFHVVTFGEGPAEQYVDFDYLDSSEVDTDIEVFVEPGDEIEQTRTSGFWVARFNLFGEDYEALVDRADEIRSDILKQPEESPEPDRYT
ncbi:MAG: ATP-grasp domain-containing protein [Halodesulfurarchaeum sp.]|nr:ATP-grasp domain-containing protein [Halodesulfurarchaeum sp.]